MMNQMYRFVLRKLLIFLSRMENKLWKELYLCNKKKKK